MSDQPGPRELRIRFDVPANLLITAVILLIAGSALYISRKNSRPEIAATPPVVTVVDSAPSEIDARLKSVVEDLRSRLAGMGLPLLTPCDPAARSGIVAFSHPDAERIGAALERAGVIVWAGDGRVRSSVHLYNDGEDVSRYIDALRSVLAGEVVAHG